MSWLLLGLALVVLAVGAFGVALARSGKRAYQRQGQVIPGVASEAPREWAGAHTPEAKLHRRIGEIVRGLRAVAGGPAESARLLELRVELEQQALAVDRRLITAAQLPGSAKEEALATVERAVTSLEAAAADLAGQLSGSADDDTALRDLGERISLAGEARRELEAIEAAAADAVNPEWSRDDRDWLGEREDSGADTGAAPGDRDGPSESRGQGEEGGTPQAGTA